MKSKKYLVGISMILASAAAFAKPNAITLDGSFINNSSTSIKALAFASDVSDNAYVKVAGVPIPPGSTTSAVYDVVQGIGVTYSIETSSLKKHVTMRLVNANTAPNQVCDWLVDSNTSQTNPPVPAGYNAAECVLSGIYDFEWRKL